VRWIVYETRNLVSGKVYVGVHLQDGEDFDGYLGSGTALLAAIAKHGAESFERRTLFVCGSLDEAYTREAEVVTEEFCKREDTYNIKTGGRGGYGHRHTEESRQRLRDYRQGRTHSPETRELISARMRDIHLHPAVREKISVAMKYANRGRVLSKETRAKISESMKRAWREGRRGP